MLIFKCCQRFHDDCECALYDGKEIDDSQIPPLHDGCGCTVRETGQIKISDSDYVSFGDAIVESDEERLERLKKLYKEKFPPGTLSPDGNYVMRDDGLWWGRCVLLMKLAK